jgi:hypothetical protein
MASASAVAVHSTSLTLGFMKTLYLQEKKKILLTGEMKKGERGRVGEYNMYLSGFFYFPQN